jgi:hypothetical protein
MHTARRLPVGQSGRQSFGIGGLRPRAECARYRMTPLLCSSGAGPGGSPRPSRGESIRPPRSSALGAPASAALFDGLVRSVWNAVLGGAARRPDRQDGGACRTGEEPELTRREAFKALCLGEIRNALPWQCSMIHWAPWRFSTHAIISRSDPTGSFGFEAKPPHSTSMRTLCDIRRPSCHRSAQKSMATISRRIP